MVHKNIKICALSSYIHTQGGKKGMGAHESERIDGEKKPAEVRRGKKEELRKRVKTLFSCFSTGSFRTCACLRVCGYVFSVLLLQNHRFFMSHFLFDKTHSLLYSWEFCCGCSFYHSIIVHRRYFDRLTFVHIQTLKIIGSFSFSFSFFSAEWKFVCSPLK